ncbi:MAG: sodium:solute symporter [Pseudomonadota bacterium]
MNDFQFGLSALDSIIVAAYLIGTMALGLWLGRKTKGTDDFFLAGRSMIWPFIGLSLFASNISSQTLIGLSSDAYRTGISVFAYEWMAAIILLVFAMFFLPLLLRSRVYTMPEFLAKRYDGRARVYLSALTLFLNIVVDTAAALYAGALVLQMVFPGIPLWQSIAFLALFAGIYTMAGGLAAVIYTDAIQAVLLLIGSTVIAVVAYNAIGGWDALTAAVPQEKLSLVRPLGDDGVPWLGLITGVPILGFYYWATNQTIVQRQLAAKSLAHGQWGAVFAGALKLIPLFIMVLPGSFAIILYPELEDPNRVFPLLMFDLLPAGLLGLTLAGFIAAIMSAIDSALNSASTLVTMDFIKPNRPNMTDAGLVRAGRITMILFMVFAMVWAPQIGQFGSLFQYLQTMFSYLVPPVVALFLVGVFWRGANKKGAFASILVGFGLGSSLFVLIVIQGIFSLHFLYVALAIFLACAVTIIVVSLMTGCNAPHEAERIEALCWSPSVRDAQRAEAATRPLWQRFTFQASLVLLAIAALLVAFW